MNNFYKNKRVFITGHTGFKGAWLTRILTLMGAQIKGYALAPDTNPSLYNLLGTGCESIISDIRDGKKLEEEVKNFRPDIIFHLAAQPLVRRSYSEPLLTYETNVLGTINLLEAVRKTPSVRAVVNITSDKCYENKGTPTRYKETDALGGFDPYSCSKSMCEMLTASYRQSFFNPADFGKTHNIVLSSCRAGNVIGGGDYAADRIIPDCARAICENKDIILRNPHATRPWQHVLEPLGGYLLLAQKMYSDISFGSAWNFGPGDSGVKTVEELVKTFIKAWGSGSYKIMQDNKLHEAAFLQLDINKAQTQLGWQPQYDFNQSSELTAAWYKTFCDGGDIKKFTDGQIKEYKPLWKI